MKFQLDGIKQVAGFIALLWVIELINILTGRALSQYGLVPRNPYSLYGIFTAPLLHGNLLHLLGNTIPLFFLGLLAHQTRRLPVAALLIVLLSGLGVWLLGRQAIHIGASGLVMGLWAYLLSYGWLTRSLSGLLLSFVTLFLYGGLIFTLLDFRQHISFEGHIAGFVAGILTAYALHRRQS